MTSKTAAPSQADVCGVVLLRRDGSALLQLRDDKPDISDPGLWVFPGGHAEPGERPDAAALREFFEETHYRCANLRLFFTCSAGDLGYPGHYNVRFFYEEYDHQQQIQCWEGQDVRFFKRAGAEYLSTPSYIGKIWDLALEISGIPGN